MANCASKVKVKKAGSNSSSYFQFSIFVYANNSKTSATTALNFMLQIGPNNKIKTSNTSTPNHTDELKMTPYKGDLFSNR